MCANYNYSNGQATGDGEKFVPVCNICGRKHWPLDPSCIGKKAAKAEAKAKLKAAKKGQTKSKAQIGKSARLEAEILETEVKAQKEAKQQLDEMARAYEQRIAKIKETLNADFELKYQAQTRRAAGREAKLRAKIIPKKEEYR